MERPWTGGFDGAAQPTNPGPRGIGAWLDNPEGITTWTCSSQVGRGTNNEAEWLALIALLEAAAAAHVPTLHIRGDSRLVVEQFAGRWKIRDTRMRTLAVRAHQIAAAIPTVTCVWVPRDANTRADTLSKACYA